MKPTKSKIVSPGPTPDVVLDENGQPLSIPPGWALLPPGDPGMTRRVKAAGPSWTVRERKGRRTFSKGVWASAATIKQESARLDAERSTVSYARKRQRDQERRQKKQADYVDQFEQAVIAFLEFAPPHREIAFRLAKAVAAHATPVGSGTVARTQRIPIEKRAESAVIAWMRHQTTAYDDLKIPRVKGKRREVRRALAEQSRKLLARYRDSNPAESSHVDEPCPLIRALEQPRSSAPGENERGQL